MKKMAKGSITLIASLLGSWIGALVDHGNWWGWSSTILGIVGFVVGIWMAHQLNDYIEG